VRHVQIGTRLDMGQYGLEGPLLHMAHWTKETALTPSEQNALHIFRRPRASKELDRRLQEGQARRDDARAVDGQEDD
jgi:hypothetical protein